MLNPASRRSGKSPRILLKRTRPADRRSAAAPSGELHRDLAARTDLRPTMAALADAARDAADAMRRGSIEGVAAAMDRTFDLRAGAMALEPTHVEMVAAARTAGGHANYTGSGGAVVVLCGDEPIERSVVAALGALPGCVVTTEPLSARSTRRV